MFNKFLLAILTVAVLSIAAPAHAFQRTEPVECPYNNVDQCFHFGDWWVTNWTQNGPVTTCSLSGGCWSCLANEYGKVQCAYGTAAGGCSCENRQREGAGPGITDCITSGTCTYRQNP
jgi:hypothetical protein